MISAHGGWPAQRYTPQVTQRWPQGGRTGFITSFLEHGIFEPVVNPIPIILAMWRFSIRLNHRTHTPIPRPENGNWIT